MILQGNQRGGSADLARHLLKQENEHVEVYEISGFVADDLKGALHEAYALSKATKAKQFLFSLSLNPPPTEKVSTEAFEDAIKRVELKLGLGGQPRAIVFHEKDGRRHCHAVWSRTNIKTMTAIHLPHTKRKLMEVSRDLYIHHEWQLPKGMTQSEAKNPLNFTLAEWQQAKRNGKDPKAIKQALQDCWATSDNQQSFTNALKERGYTLAKGDRRGFIAIDHTLEVYAVSRWVGVKTKDVRAKLADLDNLPSAEEAKQAIAQEMGQHLTQLRDQHTQAIQERIDTLTKKRQALALDHQQARRSIEEKQEQRWVRETQIRQARFRNGLVGLWDRFTGKHKAIRKQNELEALKSLKRDQHEKDQLVFQHLDQRKVYCNRIRRLHNLRNQQENLFNIHADEYNEIIHKKHDLHL